MLNRTKTWLYINATLCLINNDNKYYHQIPSGTTNKPKILV